MKEESITLTVVVCWQMGNNWLSGNESPNSQCLSIPVVSMLPWWLISSCDWTQLSTELGGEAADSGAQHTTV